MTTAAAIAVQTPTNRLGFILGFPLWSVVYAPCRPGKRTSWAKEGSHAQLPASAAFRVVEVRAGTAECDSWPPCSWLRVPPSLPTPPAQAVGRFLAGPPGDSGHVRDGLARRVGRRPPDARHPLEHCPGVRAK